jgi:hypothetical protein
MFEQVVVVRDEVRVAFRAPSHLPPPPHPYAPLDPASQGHPHPQPVCNHDDSYFS